MNKTNRIITRTGLAILMVAVSAGFLFPKKYLQPAAGEPAATLMLSRPATDAGLIDVPNRYFRAYNNPECSKSRRSGVLDVILPPDISLVGKLLKYDENKDIRVAVDEPLYLKVKATIVTDSRRQSYKTRVCSNMVSFTPVEGARYEAQQLVTNERCLLLVTDVETKSVPADFNLVPIAGACQNG